MVSTGAVFQAKFSLSVFSPSLSETEDLTLKNVWALGRWVASSSAASLSASDFTLRRRKGPKNDKNALLSETFFFYLTLERKLEAAK